ncbi:hypothetical protein DYH09_17355 [bacterium CPR1]|nr:hypothetical protein [bacterium CPR1]
MKRLTTLLLALTLAAALAQPNDRGDYEKNNWDGSNLALGEVRSPEMAGSLWKVLAYTKGHTEPNPDSRVVHGFAPGTILQADVGRGGADEVLLNAKDSQGSCWMRVRDRKGNPLNCYVRANKESIEPVVSATPVAPPAPASPDPPETPVAP